MWSILLQTKSRLGSKLKTAPPVVAFSGMHLTILHEVVQKVPWHLEQKKERKNCTRKIFFT